MLALYDSIIFLYHFINWNFLCTFSLSDCDDEKLKILTAFFKDVTFCRCSLSFPALAREEPGSFRCKGPLGRVLFLQIYGLTA